MAAPDLSAYVDVAERIRVFFERYPDGSLQASLPKVIELDGKRFIEVTVTAYRSPGDERPSVASAWEVWPGRTPYTKDSEAMNCETSAAGRALAFLGLEVRRSVATRQDIEHRAEPARADKRRLAALRGGMTKIAKTTKARQELVQLILGYPPPETLDGLGLAEVEEVERAVVDLLDGRTRLELDEQGDQRIVANVPEEVPDGAA